MLFSRDSPRGTGFAGEHMPVATGLRESTDLELRETPHLPCAALWIPQQKDCGEQSGDDDGDGGEPNVAKRIRRRFIRRGKMKQDDLGVGIGVPFAEAAEGVCRDKAATHVEDHVIDPSVVLVIVGNDISRDHGG